VSYRVALSPSSFAARDKAPLDLLQESGVEVVPNPYGRRLTEDEAIEHLRGVDGLIAGLEPLNRRVLSTANRLKAIARVGIGMDNVDLDAARELGIAVSNTPDGPSNAVAELTVAAALNMSRGLLEASNAMHEGRWEKKISKGLSDACALIVGYGRIGRRVAGLLEPFGVELLAVDPFLPESSFSNARPVNLDEGLAAADIVSLHTSGRETVLGPQEFAVMKADALLLNSARAELVDEDALIDALESGKLGGAWFDVFWEEPYSGRLTNYPQVIMSPHVGTYTKSCRLDMEITAVKNVLSDLKASSAE